MIIDLYYNNYLSIDEALVMSKNISNFFSLNNLHLTKVGCGGRGSIMVVGVDDGKHVLFGTYTTVYSWCPSVN